MLYKFENRFEQIYLKNTKFRILYWFIFNFIFNFLKGLVALITGGASGLGKGTVETLINHGLKVVIVDLPSSDGAEIAKYYGENCIFIPANVCIFIYYFYYYYFIFSLILNIFILILILIN